MKTAKTEFYFSLFFMIILCSTCALSFFIKDQLILQKSGMVYISLLFAFLLALAGGMRLKQRIRISYKGIFVTLFIFGYMVFYIWLSWLLLYVVRFNKQELAVEEQVVTYFSYNCKRLIKNNDVLLCAYKSDEIYHLNTLNVLSFPGYYAISLEQARPFFVRLENEK